MSGQDFTRMMGQARAVLRAVPPPQQRPANAPLFPGGVEERAPRRSVRRVARHPRARSRGLGPSPGRRVPELVTK